MPMPRDPKLSEAITVGKTKLYRTHGGTVWFLDVNGNERSFTDDGTANALFKAALAGAGERYPNVVGNAVEGEGVELAPRKPKQNTGFHGYFGGGVPYRSE